MAYDPASRITALTDTNASWDFTYDNLDRLETADKTGTSLEWDYDPTGNRKFEILNGTQTDYATNPISNKLDQLGAVTRTYDAVGNLEDNGAITSIYSGRNRLISTQGTLAPTLYEYNAFGERVSKQSAAQTLFAYDENGHLIGEYQSNGDLIQETIWLDDTPIATIRPNTETHNGLIAGDVKVFFIQPDHLDSPRTIVDNTNQAIWQWHSDPFGQELANQDVDEENNDFVFNLRFPGQYFDVETDTHYNYFRDYEAETGRYLQSDPIGQNGGVNTYGYVNSDPLWYYDENGLKRKPRPNRWGGKDGDIGKGGIYRIKCDNKTVYIGRTKNFRTRYHGHNGSSGILNQAQCGCNGLSFVPDLILPDDQDLRDREVSLIVDEKPELNVRHNENNRGKSKKKVHRDFRKRNSCCGRGGKK